MMERGIHLCQSHNNFVKNFKVLFDHGDKELFCNKHLVFQINEEVKSRASLKSFIREISMVDVDALYKKEDRLSSK